MVTDLTDLFTESEIEEFGLHVIEDSASLYGWFRQLPASPVTVRKMTDDDYRRVGWLTPDEQPFVPLSYDEKVRKIRAEWKNDRMDHERDLDAAEVGGDRAEHVRVTRAQYQTDEYYSKLLNKLEEEQR